MLRTLVEGGGGYLVELNRVEGDKTTRQPHIPQFLQQVIRTHKEVFYSPSGLPPYRGHEHAILLKEGCDPVSVRPYIYPQIQKNEIENLIQDML